MGGKKTMKNYNQPNPKDTSILETLPNNQPSDNEPAILKSKFKWPSNA